jgi:DNA-directed RNA polymerase
MYQQKKVPLVTSILGRRSQTTIRKPIKDQINLKKQNEGIVANVTHSFDASNISLLIKSLLETQNNINILTIHDCFATNANNVDIMAFHVKQAFVFLYLNRNFINSYHSFILQYLEKLGYIIIDNSYICINKKKTYIPEVPEFKYDDSIKENVLGSQYFIN